jgi:hypothetical protein
MPISIVRCAKRHSLGIGVHAVIGYVCNVKMSPPVLLALAVLTGAPARTSALPSQPATAPTSLPPNPGVIGEAKDWFHRFQAGQIDRSRLSGEVNAQLTDAMIRQEATILKAFGEPSSFTLLRTYPIKDVPAYDFLLQFNGARIIEVIALTNDDKLAGIDFAMFGKPPSMRR